MFMELFGWVGDPQAWIALATLAAIEIVLGIDNIIFISILVGRLPEHQRNTARTTGLMAAMVTRLGLLLTLAWIMKLTAPPPHRHGPHRRLHDTPATGHA